MPTRLCANPSCPNPATYRGRCAVHARANEKVIQRAGRHFYGTKRWQLLRSRVLFEQPLCATPGCAAISEDVHHIVDIDDGGPVWARSNLEAHCHSHHSSLTRRGQLA